MIRIILVAIMVVGFLVLSIPVLLVEGLIKKKTPKKQQYQSLRIIQGVFRLLLKVSGVTITTKGLEHIPKDQSVLYVGNHRSYFDVLVGYVTVPHLSGFVAKKEMEKWPLLSNWMRDVNCLFLDRVDMKEGLKTILAGIDKIKNGISIWIFPEGTRNRKEDSLDLLPFKEGSLKMAEKAGCPVIPVAFSKTADIFEKHVPRVTPAHVTIEFGVPINLKELTPEQKKFSGAFVRDVIIGMLEKEVESI